MLKIYLRTLATVHSKAYAAWLIAGNIVFVGLSLLEPVFFREIIDSLVAFGDSAEKSLAPLTRVLVWWTVVGIILLTVRGIVSLGADRLSHQTALRLKSLYFTHLLDLSMRFHLNTHSGKSLKILHRGSDGIFWLLLSFLRNVFSNILTILLLFPFAIYLNWRLGSLLIVFVLVFVAIAIPMLTYTHKRQSQVEDLRSEESARIGDAITNIASVKSFARGQHERAAVNALQQKVLGVQYPILNWWATLVTLSRIGSTVILICIFFYGSALHLRGLASIGDIVMFVGFAAMLLNALETLLWQVFEIFWHSHSIREFFEVLDKKLDIIDRTEAKTMPRAMGRVEFKDITFCHVPDRPALQNISFVANPGEIIALVGHTGAGKSTVANLLSRFYDVQKGEILIDDFEIRAVTQDSLRQNIGIVFQESLLFHDTLLENIRVGNPDATEAEVIDAAQKAEAWDFIQKLPEGLHTLVGERGVKLSGGERQRVAIARVILKDPPILVLDEATSALDAVTEKKLQEALARLMENRTTFIIAHRLSTIRKADHILVFAHGQIVERGNYTDLLRQKGVFAEMVEAQTSGFVV